MSEDRYLSPKRASKSYRPRSYVMSPGLLRARAPFRLQNALTGVVLAGFATAVWAYSIRAVKQDDFSDVDDEAREMMRGKQMGGDASSLSLSLAVDEDADVVGMGVSRERTSTLAADDMERPHTRSQPTPRGVLAPTLDRAFPHLLDPTRKTLVWGAPPVDDLGRVSLQSSTEGRR
ncbi:hypothetical protein J3R82DRAFT_4576 [Butyriboletus roseoflavus]|nr:hypothetical protein J3R82DRAFT_4576 [Butyriboletus roseoflavus]